MVKFLKVKVPLILVLLLFGVMAARVYYLQCTEQKDFDNRKTNQIRVTSSVEALRGQITDCKGAIFAMSTTSPMLWCDPKDVTNPEGEAKLIAEILEKPFNEILSKASRSNRYVVVQRGLVDVESHKIRALMSQGKLPGFHLKNEQKRVYPKHELLGVQIGLCDSSNHGSFGIERGADYYLSGIDGLNTVWRDNARRSFFTLESLDLVFEPQDGQTVCLTIDETLQQIAQNELLKAAEKFTPKRAGVIMLDPSTGDILAMASWPFYDPNDRAGYEEGIFNNLLLSDPFEPGSIMKTISGSLALDHDIVTLSSMIDCERGLWKTPYGRLLHDDHKLGVVTFKNVIKFSSNIGIAKVGTALGRDELYKGLLAFGFGAKADLIVLGGESPGILRNSKKWTEYSLTSIPMGQEIGVTALQMVSAIGTIANRGVRMRPRLVKRISMPDGVMSPEARDFNYFQPIVANASVISPSAARDMTEAMVAVTDDDGTGRLVDIPGFKVAGKTGTAQKFDQATRSYSKSKYTATFAGFAPANNPRFACVVVVDEPKNKIYGGTVAAPIFRDVAKAALEYLQVPLEEEFDEPENNEEERYVAQ